MKRFLQLLHFILTSPVVTLGFVLKTIEASYFAGVGLAEAFGFWLTEEGERSKHENNDLSV